MKKVIPLIIALAFASMSGASAQLIVKTVDQSELAFGYMSVNELPSAGGAFFSAGSVPISDITATFNSPTSVTFSPNTTSLTGPQWYDPSTGGPGSLGQKIMSGYLFAQETGTLSGTLSFTGDVLAYNLGTNLDDLPYSLTAVVKDFAPDFSSVNQVFLPLTGTGLFELSLPLVAGAGRHVQWGFIMTGPNIWPSDAAQLANAGSVTVIPEPSTYALLGLAAVGGLLARRFRRKV
jgi:hypothetical protein